MTEAEIIWFAVAIIAPFLVAIGAIIWLLRGR